MADQFEERAREIVDHRAIRIWAHLSESDKASLANDIAAFGRECARSVASPVPMREGETLRKALEYDINRALGHIDEYLTPDEAMRAIPKAIAALKDAKATLGAHLSTPLPADEIREAKAKAWEEGRTFAVEWLLGNVPSRESAPMLAAPNPYTNPVSIPAE